MKYILCISALALLWIATPVEASYLKSMNPADVFPNRNAIALAKAVGNDEIATIKTFLDAGVDVNTRGKEGVTPLLWAMANGSKGSFEFLLKNGANPNLQMAWGESVMSIAAIGDDPIFLEMALKHGGNPNLVNPESGRTPIFGSIDNFRINNIKLLIAAAADVNFRDSSGNTPALHAANINRYDLVLVLLEAGADPLVKNNWGKTLIDRVRRSHNGPNGPLNNSREEVIKLLKNNGIL